MEESSIFECGHALLDIYVQSFLYSKIKLIRVRCLCQRVVGPAFVLEGFGTYMHAFEFVHCSVEETAPLSLCMVETNVISHDFAKSRLSSFAKISNSVICLRHSHISHNASVSLNMNENHAI